MTTYRFEEGRNLTTYTWTTIRDDFCERVQELPGAQLEADVVEHFTDDPERVIRVLDKIAAQHARKPLRSPWAVARSELNRPPADDVKVDSTRSRDKLIDHAKAWIHNAGHYHDTWKAAAIELLGDDDETPTLEYLEKLDEITRDSPGRSYYDSLLTASIKRTRDHGPQPIPGDTHAPLYTLRDDENARTTLLAYWHDQRPRGIQADHNFEQWNAQSATTWATIRNHNKLLQAQAQADDPDDDIPF